MDTLPQRMARVGGVFRGGDLYNHLPRTRLQFALLCCADSLMGHEVLGKNSLQCETLKAVTTGHSYLCSKSKSYQEAIFLGMDLYNLLGCI